MPLKDTLERIVADRERRDFRPEKAEAAPAASAAATLADIQRKLDTLMKDKAISAYVDLHARIDRERRGGNVAHIRTRGRMAYVVTPFRDDFLLDEKRGVEFPESVELTMAEVRRALGSQPVADRLRALDKAGIGFQLLSDPDDRPILGFDYDRLLSPRARSNRAGELRRWTRSDS
ncbi:MAG: hypothetical protein KAG89_04555 [Fulvimarina manganoxydans]|uniref:hypothetical protein n=1 Tax=Fulvimarina manganoxydans TaxID=937218 RepID=UPI0023562671|nr:hypothetical protein [Fulvimarina manganoxydans]MCK5931423.1 hypothetical protein [Fulvimarina manganoxydans]